MRVNKLQKTCKNTKGKKEEEKTISRSSFYNTFSMLLCYVHDHITFQEPIQQDIKNTFLRL